MSSGYPLAIQDGKLVASQDVHTDDFQSNGPVSFGGAVSVAGDLKSEGDTKFTGTTTVDNIVGKFHADFEQWFKSIENRSQLLSDRYANVLSMKDMIEENQKKFAACCFYTGQNFTGDRFCLGFAKGQTKWDPNLGHDFDRRLNDSIQSVRCSKHAKTEMGDNEHHNSGHWYHIYGGQEHPKMYSWHDNGRGKAHTTALRLYKCDNADDCKPPRNFNFRHEVREERILPNATSWSTRH